MLASFLHVIRTNDTFTSLPANFSFNFFQVLSKNFFSESKCLLGSVIVTCIGIIWTEALLFFLSFLCASSNPSIALLFQLFGMKNVHFFSLIKISSSLEKNSVLSGLKDELSTISPSLEMLAMHAFSIKNPNTDGLFLNIFMLLIHFISVNIFILGLSNKNSAMQFRACPQI